MGRRIKLDEHVGKVDRNVWALRDDECACPVFLTDRDRYTILSHLTPYGYWPTRFVSPSYDELWEMADDAEWETFREHFTNLVLKLTGGDPMACNAELAAALNNIAAALRSAGGGGSCSGTVVDCIFHYTDDEFLDTPPDPVDPQGQTPPEGFDTMQEYLTWKCQAANWILGWLVGFARGLSGWGVTSITVGSAGALVAALLGALGVIVFPPVAILAVVGAVVALGALSTGAFVGGTILADYFEENKDDLICSLYSSGSAAEALAGIAAFIEDALQSAEMAAFLAGMPSGTGEAIGAVFGQIQTNALVAPLFRIVADVVFPSADCSECEQTTGLIVKRELNYPFGTVTHVGASYHMVSEQDGGFYRINVQCCLAENNADIRCAEIDDWSSDETFDENVDNVLFPCVGDETTLPKPFVQADIQGFKGLRLAAHAPFEVFFTLVGEY